MDSKFFNFISPYLKFIDSGNLFRQPFGWLYTLMAALNLLLPFYVLYQAIANHIFQLPAKYFFGFFFAWIIIAAACWIGFQLWWDRKAKVNATSSMGDDFIVTPVFAHFIQTFGEWLGTFVAIVGTLLSVFASIFLGGQGSMLGQSLGLGFLNIGFSAIIIMPIMGFIIIVVSRFLAELCRALAAIANNTRRG